MRHHHAGRSVYRQASVSGNDRRTCDRPGRRGEDRPPDEGDREDICYRRDMDVPSCIDIEKLLEMEYESCEARKSWGWTDMRLQMAESVTAQRLTSWLVVLASR